jgi:hypothetical protein
MALFFGEKYGLEEIGIRVEIILYAWQKSFCGCGLPGVGLRGFAGVRRGAVGGLVVGVRFSSEFSF